MSKLKSFKLTHPSKMVLSRVFSAGPMNPKPAGFYDLASVGDSLSEPLPDANSKAADVTEFGYADGDNSDSDVTSNPPKATAKPEDQDIHEMHRPRTGTVTMSGLPGRADTDWDQKGGAARCKQQVFPMVAPA